MRSHAPPKISSIIDSDHFRAVHVHGVVVVWWLSDSRPDEYPPLTRFIVDAAGSAGGKVDLVAVVSPIRSVPNLGLYQALAAFAVGTRTSIDKVYIVFVGPSGFWQTIARSMTTRLMAVAEKYGSVTHQASLEAALGLVCERRDLDAEAMRAVLEPAELVEPSAGESRSLASLRLVDSAARRPSGTLPPPRNTG